ncbi:hypothetical protein ZYGR_0AD00680 [Zygosaccharomyces rouxii]|uniref:Multicopper oxidase n=1 Tax=Zygosaccharomyces rouxii TaxID=4956 RepID=A0A1Q3A580_ZYGRO|nr:hypothetical protein ZYGR_0AD00680 [Zygosaccharomyces rouxii]
MDESMGGTLEYRRDNKRHAKAWSLVIALMMVCSTLILYKFFSIQCDDYMSSIRMSFSDKSAQKHDGDEIDTGNAWRLDTASNYSIDLDYWLKQEEPMEMHYYFNVSTVQEVHPDGVSRTLTVINGQYPGPLVEASSGDTVVIHVENHMDGDPLTIHCHGLLMKDQAFNDGSSWINQCPIPAAGSYEYRIKLDDDQYGTYWYHSHYATQYADGVFGPLVIHSKKEYEDLDFSYDKELVVMVNDYYHDTSYSYMSTYMGSGNENTEPVPDNGLIQGQNHFEYVDSQYLVPHGAEKKRFAHEVPHTVLDLDPNSIYRVRVINAGFFLPFEFGLEGHMLKVVEADGTLVEPIQVESLTLSVAQRYSFVLLPQDPDFNKKNYWMHAHFNQFCTKEENPNFNMDVKAIVNYNDNSNSVEKTSWTYNGGDVLCRDFDQSKLKTLNKKVPSAHSDSNLPDVRVDIDILWMIGAYQMARGYLNDKTYLPLQNGSTMYQLGFAPGANTVKDWNDNQLLTFSDNQYMINLNQRGQVVDLVINNYDDGAHPFHLHGHKFWVLAIGDSGYFQDEYYDTNDDEQAMNFDNPIFRDTVNIPGFGWAVIRFVVDNPGVWPFHCHIGWHMEAGLLLQINALQEEYASWNHYPQNWYSQCQYWQDKL